jgi:PadR family transcriptional regulator PadR
MRRKKAVIVRTLPGTSIQPALLTISAPRERPLSGMPFEYSSPKIIKCLSPFSRLEPSRQHPIAQHIQASSPGYLHLIPYLCRLSSMVRRSSDVRMSLQTLKVLEVFLDNPTDELSGADFIKRSGIASGTLYPILFRLESAGWFVSRWEKIDPATAGRPRRRLYRLTPTGLQHASNVLASFTFRRGLPA